MWQLKDENKNNNNLIHTWYGDEEASDNLS